MRLFRSLLLFVLLVGVAALAPAQDADYAAVLGYWEGAYMRDGSIQVVKLDLVERDGQLQGLFTIPDLGIYRTPARGGVRFENGWLRYNFTYGQTALLLDPEAAELRGEAIAQRDSIVSRIQLKRTLRPAPPPIHEEHLTFEVGEVTMAGTLVRPAWRRAVPIRRLLSCRGVAMALGGGNTLRPNGSPNAAWQPLSSTDAGGDNRGATRPLPPPRTVLPM